MAGMLEERALSVAKQARDWTGLDSRVSPLCEHVGVPLKRLSRRTKCD